MKQLENKIDSILNLSNQFLDLYSKINDSFFLRSFYGEEFIYSYLLKSNIHNASLVNKLVSKIKNRNRDESNYHFEFINYALIEAIDLIDDVELRNRLENLKFKGTTNTNWSLLRNLVILKKTSNDKVVEENILKIIKANQDSSGLIHDSDKDISFQYHCFSAVLIAEAHIETNNSKFLDSFNKGMEFILNFILPSGNSLYVGRGQFQSFGLASLIYALSLYQKFNSNLNLFDEINKLLDLIMEKQDLNGHIPLCFSESNNNLENANLYQEKFVGWYSYNNYFDYYGFLIFFLSKAKAVLSVIGENTQSRLQAQGYFNKQFIVFKNNNYHAIVSKPFGNWSNSLAIPLVEVDKKIITPVSGGEQFEPSLIDSRNLSLPHLYKFNIPWTRLGFCFLTKRKLIVISLMGVLVRNFKFKEDIEIDDFAISIFPSVSYFNFLMDYNSFEFKKKVTQVKDSYSPSGRLKCYASPLNQKLILKVRYAKG